MHSLQTVVWCYDFERILWLIEISVSGIVVQQVGIMIRTPILDLKVEVEVEIMNDQVCGRAPGVPRAVNGEEWPLDPGWILSLVLSFMNAAASAPCVTGARSSSLFLYIRPVALNQD